MAKFIEREDVKQMVISLAGQRFPQEACGFIVQKGKNFTVAEVPNVHPSPMTDFKTRGGDWDAAEADGGKVVAVWHSHPNGKAEASPADKTSSEDLEIPFLIYALPLGEFTYYEPSGWIHPLIGRPFIHGLLDCYALARDHYRLHVGITLPNFVRQDDWWHVKGGPNPLVENCAAAGFREVENLQQHDCLLMSLNHGIANHCGVYLGGGLMLHHPPHSPSAVIPYNRHAGGPYPRATIAVYRHESLAGKALMP